MHGRNERRGCRSQQLAQFIFENHECHGCDFETLDSHVSELITRLSCGLLRCKEHLAHAGIELRIRIVLCDNVAVLNGIENWNSLSAGLQNLLIAELELATIATAFAKANAA